MWRKLFIIVAYFYVGYEIHICAFEEKVPIIFWKQLFT